MMNLMILLVFLCLLVGLGYLVYRRQSSELQRHQKQGLETACHLLEWIKLLQQHRGITTAMFAGQNNSSTKLEVLALRIEQRLESLDNNPLMTKQQHWQNIKLKWQSLKKHQSSAGVLDNFERHCDLLLDVHALIQDLMDDYGLTTAHQDEQRLLAKRTFSQLPSLIENLGQLRALTAHAAANNGCITAFRLHLQFLIEQLSRQQNTLQQSTEQDDSLGILINSLLSRVKNEILQTEYIEVKPEEMFRAVTLVMETGYSDIEAGVHQLNGVQT